MKKLAVFLFSVVMIIYMSTSAYAAKWEKVFEDSQKTVYVAVSSITSSQDRKTFTVWEKIVYKPNSKAYKGSLDIFKKHTYSLRYCRYMVEKPEGCLERFIICDENGEKVWSHDTPNEPFQAIVPDSFTEQVWNLCIRKIKKPKWFIW